METIKDFGATKKLAITVLVDNRADALHRLPGDVRLRPRNAAKFYGLRCRRDFSFLIQPPP